MIIVVSLIIIACGISIFTQVKDIITKVCLYSFVTYWGISLICSTFNPFGMSDNSNYTYLILILGMISFVAGMILFQNASTVKNFKISRIRLINETNIVVKNKLLVALYIICTLFALKYATNALLAAAISGGAIMDDARGDLIFNNSGLAKLFYYYIVNPLYFVTLSILFIEVLGVSKKNWIFITFAILFIIACIILGGGRSKFVIIFMYFLFTYLCINQNNIKKILKPKKILITIGLGTIMITAMALQTGYRATGKYSLTGDGLSESLISMGETFGTYSVIPIKLLDYSFENDYVDKFGGFQYGRATIAGLDEILCGVAKRITGIPISPTMRIVDYTQDNPIYIIPGKHPYNYCYTALFYCYMDFGIFGVIIIPFFIGIVFRYYIFQFYKYNSLPSFILISFGYFMMMHSLFQNYFIKNWTLIVCLTLALIQYIFYTKRLKFTLSW